MERKKLRELGWEIGVLPVGRKNCMTDVDGVLVGHETLQYEVGDNEYVCTGVTAILPHEGNVFYEKVIATNYVFNGYGKTTGLIQLNELGKLESPIMLTNTFSVPAVTEGAMQYLFEQNAEIGHTDGTVNIVVGECNDSYLNSIRELAVRPKHAIQAIKRATSNRVEEGAVGAGTGMVCFDYKGGIGSSSRKVKLGAGKKYTLGCLVLTNFGRESDLLRRNMNNKQRDSKTTNLSDGSIIIVLATDAPLQERQLQRIAKRCGIGLGHTGSNMDHGSGDIVIAFSTAHKIPHHSDHLIEQMNFLREDQAIMNLFFTAAAEVTEEAIFNSLSCAKTTKGRKGRQIEAIPFELLNKIL